jgi:hypothetical protein
MHIIGRIFVLLKESNKNSIINDLLYILEQRKKIDFTFPQNLTKIIAEQTNSV